MIHLYIGIASNDHIIDFSSSNRQYELCYIVWVMMIVLQ